jgi:metallo-beta-lactamase family protein
MRLNFHGAAQTVTGSQHLLEINGSKLLLDCGLYQGHRKESYARNLNFSYNPRSLDAVILSHAHIDHSGNLPNLIRQGFAGPIYTTRATADLADIMLRDSGHIQESDAAFINKKLRGGETPVEPIYTMADAERVAGHFHSVEYKQQFEPIPGVTAQFFDAGHILGSAGLLLEINEKGRKIRFWFSGDIGRFNLPLLLDPVLPEPVDYLLMECTYGDKPHSDPRLAFDEFRQVVTKTIARGGKVIIPAFAVGRTQELVFYLNEMEGRGELKPVPVYVDSPLAVNTTDVFRRHPECFDEETRTFVQQNKHPALEFKNLTYIRSVDESKALNERKEPMIIISASGMAETGRILHHLKNNIENPRNTILIVSWQAPDTLGRHLADRDKRVRIFGEPYDVRAEISTIGGLSGHAGQDLLIRYAAAVKKQVRQVFLVHGEPSPASILMDKLKEQSLGEIHYPALHSGVDL